MTKATFLVDGKEFSYFGSTMEYFINALQSESEYIGFADERGVMHCLNKNYISVMMVEEVKDETSNGIL